MVLMRVTVQFQGDLQLLDMKYWWYAIWLSASFLAGLDLQQWGAQGIVRLGRGEAGLAKKKKCCFALGIFDEQ